MTFERISWPRHTERLSIRPATSADLPTVFAYRSLPEVAEWMPGRPPTYDDWLLNLGRADVMERTLVIELDGAVIGDLYLKVDDAWAQAEVRDQATGAEAEIGWCLSPEHQGRGYVSEGCVELLRICFDDLGVRRVVAQAFAGNEPSLRVMDRLGMVCEAHFRSDSLHRDHGWVDGVVYAVLADEWRAAQRR